jgi:hypothetical protein
MIVKSVCKNNRYFCEDDAMFKEFENLIVGESYELTLDANDDMMYHLIVDGKKINSDGYVFFGVTPVFDKYDYKIFFYSKEELRDMKIDSII